MQNGEQIHMFTAEKELGHDSMLYEFYDFYSLIFLHLDSQECA